MVTATEWLKKAEAKRSKNPSKFKAERRRAWDYIDSTSKLLPEPTSTTIPNELVNEPNEIWEQKEEQIGIKDGNNEEQNWEQIRNVNGNIREQKEEQYKNKNRNEYKNKQAIKPSADPLLNLDDTTVRKRLLTLTGHQKQVMSHITSHLKSRVGEPYMIDILPNILAAKIHAGLEVTRVSLKRLAGKHLVIRLAGERGRNGCCKFQIPENVVKICFSLFNDVPCDINHIGNEIGNNNRNNIPYSSSNINNITTTLPEKWEQIDFSLLESIGFSKTQLFQLYEKQLNSPEIIQDSINHFAYGLENNPKFKIYHAPLNVLMGVLRKGQKWHEPSYISPQELALSQLLNEKKKKKERLDTIIKELLELEFPDWKKQLTEEQIKKIVPADIMKTNLSAAIQSSLRNYYTEHVLMKRLEADGIKLDI